MSKTELPSFVGHVKMLRESGGKVTCACKCGRAEVTYSTTYYRRASKSGAELRCQLCVQDVTQRRPRASRERYLPPVTSTAYRGRL